MAWQAQRQGRYAEATSLLRRDGVAVGAARRRAPRWTWRGATWRTPRKAEGNFDLARSLLEQVAAASQARGDVRGVASALNGLGDRRGVAGRSRLGPPLPSSEPRPAIGEIDDRWGIARVLADLAHIDLQARRLRRGESLAHGRRCRPFARSDTSAASPVSWSRCRGAPAASRATTRRCGWRAPRRRSG